MNTPYNKFAKTWPQFIGCIVVDSSYKTIMYKAVEFFYEQQRLKKKMRIYSR